MIVVEGKADATREASGTVADLAAEVAQMKALALTRAQATALLASRHGLSRRRAYELWLAATDQPSRDLA